VTRWVRFSLSVADSFACRCLTSWTCFRLHTPLMFGDLLRVNGGCRAMLSPCAVGNKCSNRGVL
jgi:hypothetical protein